MADDDPTMADIFIAAVLKVAGPEGLAKIRALASGTMVSVPIYATEGSVIVRALGMDDAQRLCTELRVLDAEGRATAIPPVYIAKGRSERIERRRDRVAELRLHGKAKRDIAVELDVTEKTVLSDINVLRKDGRLPPNLPSPYPHDQARKLQRGAGSDHPANIGGMVSPSDEVPS